MLKYTVPPPAAGGVGGGSAWRIAGLAPCPAASQRFREICKFVSRVGGKVCPTDQHHVKPRSCPHSLPRLVERDVCHNIVTSQHVNGEASEETAGKTLPDWSGPTTRSARRPCSEPLIRLMYPQTFNVCIGGATGAFWGCYGENSPNWPLGQIRGCSLCERVPTVSAPLICLFGTVESQGMRPRDWIRFVEEVLIPALREGPLPAGKRITWASGVPRRLPHLTEDQWREVIGEEAWKRVCGPLGDKRVTARSLRRWV